MGYLGMSLVCGVFLEALGVFWGIAFCPYLHIPVNFNPEYPPGLRAYQFLVAGSGSGAIIWFQGLVQGP